MAKPPGLESPTESARLRVDDVEALLGLGEEVAPFVIDDAHLAENVAGEILDRGIAEGGENGAVALGDRHVRWRPSASASAVEMPPPNWVMKVLGAFLIT